jgi:DNA-binding Xre family transcriptional regulator
MTDNSYTNWNAMSDEVLIDQIGHFVNHHRMKQNKTLDVLSTEAGISRSTLGLLERGETVTLATLVQSLECQIS